MQEDRVDLLLLVLIKEVVVEVVQVHQELTVMQHLPMEVMVQLQV
jgi:hypothetical protein